MYRREHDVEFREKQLKEQEDDLAVREERWKQFQHLMDTELHQTIQYRRSSRIAGEQQTRQEQSTVAPAGSDFHEVDDAEEVDLHHEAHHQTVDQVPPPKNSIAAAVMRKRRIGMASLSEDAAVVVEVPEGQTSDHPVHTAKKSVKTIVSSTRTTQKKAFHGSSQKRTQEESDSGTPKKVTARRDLLI